jgi:AraC-like DNA-binding protein
MVKAIAARGKTRSESGRRGPRLETLAARLPQPAHQLVGRRHGAIVMPENVVGGEWPAAIEGGAPGGAFASSARWLFVIALKGAGILSVDGRVVRLAAGEGWLTMTFRSGLRRAVHPRGCDWRYIAFDLADANLVLSLQDRPFTLTSAMRRLAVKLIGACEGDDRRSELPVLLLALLLARLRHQDQRWKKSRDFLAPDVLLHVNRLARPMDRRVPQTEIARLLGISLSHLRARFRCASGMSLGRHLRRLRLEQARGLLRQTPNRVLEVAEICGFNSSYSFSRAFRSAYGLSPMEYRRSSVANGAVC